MKNNTMKIKKKMKRINTMRKKWTETMKKSQKK